MSACVLVTATLALFLPGAAHAAPPANDDFDSSTAITSFPFSTTQVLAEATRDIDDPYACTDTPKLSVWYHHTATEDGLLRLGSAGSDHNVSIKAFTGYRGDLREVWSGCSSNRTKPATISVRAGTTYYFMVSNPGTSAGTTKLTVERKSRLANDDFANAQPIANLPVSIAEPDYPLATYETDEPWAEDCLGGEGARSVWYSYTPQRTQSVLIQVKSTWYSGPVAAVFTGTSLTELQVVGCASRSPGGEGVVQLTAGTKYYLQISGAVEGYQAPATVTLEPRS